jgi:hypothetical protein
MSGEREALIFSLAASPCACGHERAKRLQASASPSQLPGPAVTSEDIALGSIAHYAKDG